MKKIKQYKIIYPDSFNKDPLTVELADFWWFSGKDIERQNPKEVNNIDFDFLMFPYRNEEYVINRIRALYNPKSIKRLQRQFDAMLKHLCDYTPEKKSKNKDLNSMPPKEETGTQKAMNDYIKKIEKIRREQSEEDYHQLRSLFRIKLENREQYAFRLFSLYDEGAEAGYYPLPFNGDNVLYSVSAYNIISCIVILIDIFHWGYVPFCTDIIRKYLFYLMSPLSLDDSVKDISNTDKQNNYTTFRVKNDEQREQDQQLIIDILDRHWNGSSLLTYSRSYDNLLTAFKEFIDECRPDNKKLVLDQVAVLKKLYYSMEKSIYPSSSLIKLTQPLKTVIDDIESAPGTLAIIEGVFKSAIYSNLKDLLYRKLFALMIWVKENKNQFPEWSEKIANNPNFIDTCISDFKDYAQRFPDRINILIPDTEPQEELRNHKLYKYAPHIHYYSTHPEYFF